MECWRKHSAEYYTLSSGVLQFTSDNVLQYWQYDFILGHNMPVYMLWTIPGSGSSMDVQNSISFLFSIG